MVDTRREEAVCAAQDGGGDRQEHKILEEEAKSAGQAKGKRRAGRWR